MTAFAPRHGGPDRGPDSRYAVVRLVVSLLLGTIGNGAVWSVVVVLPAVETEFGVSRGLAALPYTATMIGFAVGGMLMGRLADRFGIMVPVLIGIGSIALGYAGAAQAQSIWTFALAQGLLLGFFGSAALFAPLMADISHWFTRRRGMAVAIAASGNYLSGAVWPPAVQFLAGLIGWRHTYLAAGAFCVVTMLPLAFVLRPRLPGGAAGDGAGGGRPALPALSPGGLQGLLALAALTCCLAMAMPQVHIVAYCSDLGYGVARGAEMLALMLGLGVISRLASGWIADRIGGVRTLLLGSALQCLTLVLYLPFDGLASLYIVSALFGLSQGGIVPSYAIIVREYLPAHEAGARIGMVMMASVIGMALGGWLSGAIFDWTGSYQAAFLNGIAWNFVNVAIALWLLFNRPRRPALA